MNRKITAENLKNLNDGETIETPVELLRLNDSATKLTFTKMVNW